MAAVRASFTFSYLVLGARISQLTLTLFVSKVFFYQNSLRVALLDYSRGKRLNRCIQLWWGWFVLVISRIRSHGPWANSQCGEPTELRWLYHTTEY